MYFIYDVWGRIYPLLTEFVPTLTYLRSTWNLFSLKIAANDGGNNLQIKEIKNLLSALTTSFE